MHELAELPHQGLMAIDERLGLVAIVVETGRRHRRLDLLHRLLVLCDLRFEVGDLRLDFLRALLALALLGLLALALFVIGRRIFCATNVAPYRRCSLFLRARRTCRT